MPQSCDTAYVRDYVDEVLSRLGACGECDLSETILISDGHYCGRRFFRDGFDAVWFVEENQLKIHDRDGSLLEVIRLRSRAAEHQRVA